MLWAMACQAEPSPPELPPAQIQGDFFAYAADAEYEVCPGTVVFIEGWMEAVAVKLGMDPTKILPTTYYLVEESVLSELCSEHPSGGFTSCARRQGDRIEIFSNELLLRHELVHALHLSVWPRRQPILHEGLAIAFDDTDLLEIYQPPYAALDGAIEAKTALDDEAVYGFGAFLIYWIVRRHGPESLSRFWNATSRPTSAADFRVAFEQELGESLDAMLADVGTRGCIVPTCAADEARPWIDDRWTTTSPQGCEDDSVLGIVGGGRHTVARQELVEIAQAGVYEISISKPADLGHDVHTVLDPCDLPENPSVCPNQLIVESDQPEQYQLEAGTYRVATFQFEAGEPSYEVEIRPVP